MGSNNRLIIIVIRRRTCIYIYISYYGYECYEHIIWASGISLKYYYCVVLGFSVFD